MNNQERDVITTIFQRLEQAASQPRDPEVERLIADKIRAQPYAPYAMAQLIYVQEEAIKSLNQQLEEARAAQQQPSGPGGFLSSIFGGGRQDPQPQQGRPGAWGQQPQQQGGPWGGQNPQQGYPQQGGPWGGQQQQRGGSGFLGTALTTAAGVAGGMVVGSALMNAFSGSSHSSLGSLSSSDMSALGGAGAAGATPASADTDWAGNDSWGNSGLQDASAFGNDASVQDASFDSGNDFGSDFGSGSDDWS